MLRWAKRLMGRTDEATTVRSYQEPDRGPDQGFGEPPTEATDAYFESMSEMQTAIAEHDYETAAVRARENLAVIPAWIEEEKARSAWEAEFGNRWGVGVETESATDDTPLLPPSIPVLRQGGTILALVGDVETLRAMADLAKRTTRTRALGEQARGSSVQRQPVRRNRRGGSFSPRLSPARCEGTSG